MKQYGVRYPSGEVLTDNHWNSIADVMAGFQGFEYKRTTELGELVWWDGEEWKEVEHGTQRSND